MLEKYRNKINEIEKSEGVFAMWRMPDEKEVHFISAEKANYISVEDLKFNSGFAIFPFRGEDGFIIPSSEITVRESFIPGHYTKPQFYYSKEEYLNIFEKFIEVLRDESFSKLVLSRVKKIETGKQIDAINLFENLCSLYPNAFVYYLKLPECGTWLGATPEKLIRFDKNKITTVSLAGTQKNTGVALNEIQWGKKEKDEQEYITRYIEELLDQSGFSNYKLTGPYTTKAGSIVHIRTDFEIERNENVEIYSFVKALHPTPAVCGIPKDDARKFILSTENHNRMLYSGFLGPVNKDTSGDLFVNLRCMQLSDGEANLFAGGGITKDSIGESEWNETEMKMEVMGRVLNPPSHSSM